MRLGREVESRLELLRVRRRVARVVPAAVVEPVAQQLVRVAAVGRRLRKMEVDSKMPGTEVEGRTSIS